MGATVPQGLPVCGDGVVWRAGGACLQGGGLRPAPQLLPGPLHGPQQHEANRPTYRLSHQPTAGAACRGHARRTAT